MPKLKIGITGGIGSGKSAVSKFFTDAGYKVLYADEIAKQIYVDDNKVKEKIIKHFGSESFINGELNKDYLAKKVFSDPEKVKTINTIVHPPTISRIQSLMKNELEKKDIVFCEAALIFEANMVEIFDHILFVAAEEEKKIERIQKRDNLTKDQILKRMANQLPDNSKRGRSDFIIENNSTLEELNNKAEFFLNLFESLASG